MVPNRIEGEYHTLLYYWANAEIFNRLDKNKKGCDYLKTKHYFLSISILYNQKINTYINFMKK